MPEITILKQMELQETMQVVNAIFAEVLEQDDLTLTPEASANDLEGWDSLNHIRILAAIEKRFNIKFTATEMLAFGNVGDICRAINHKKD